MAWASRPPESSHTAATAAVVSPVASKSCFPAVVFISCRIGRGVVLRLLAGAVALLTSDTEEGTQPWWRLPGCPRWRPVESTQEPADVEGLVVFQVVAVTGRHEQGVPLVPDDLGASATDSCSSMTPPGNAQVPLSVRRISKTATASRMSATRSSSRRLTGRPTPRGSPGHGFSARRPDVHGPPSSASSSRDMRIRSNKELSFEVDEQVDVAVGPVVAARGGAEEANPAGVMARGDGHYLLAPGLNQQAQRPGRLISQLSTSRQRFPATFRITTEPARRAGLCVRSRGTVCAANGLKDASLAPPRQWRSSWKAHHRERVFPERSQFGREWLAPPAGRKCPGRTPSGVSAGGGGGRESNPPATRHAALWF